jgi:hypothetical protein
MTPVLNKLLTVQLIIQKRIEGIVFDNDTQGRYDIIISGIGLACLRRIGYSKKLDANAWPAVVTTRASNCNRVQSVGQDLLINAGYVTIWYRPRHLCVTNYLGPSEPLTAQGIRRRVRVHQARISLWKSRA